MSRTDRFDAMEKALRRLVDKDLTYSGRPEEVCAGISADDVDFARAVLEAIDKERASHE